MNVTETLHNAIQKVWVEHIPADYQDRFLHREDSLKNAFYFHLRSVLGDAYLRENNLRIFTEFHYGNLERPNERADLAVVRLDTDGNIIEVLNVVEFKFKGHGVSDRPYLSDVNKAIQYIRRHPNERFAGTHFYLAFLNETSFEPLAAEHLSYTTARQRKAAAGRITELLGYQENEVSTWYCLRH